MGKFHQSMTKGKKVKYMAIAMHGSDMDMEGKGLGSIKFGRNELK